MSARTERAILLGAVIVLGLSNCATLLTAWHAASERDRMVGEAIHCYNAFNAVHAAALDAGACVGTVR